MDFVKFRKVNYEQNMPETIVNGSIYFVKDTNKIFADFDGVRKSYNLSESDVESIVEDIVEDSLEDIKTALEAVEATLDEDVEDNYTALKNNLKEIGKYSTTAEVTAMISGAISGATRNYGTIADDKIVLDNSHTIFKVDTNETPDIDINTTALSNFDNVNFQVLVENGNTTVPNFLFQPITLDKSTPITYTNKYTLLDVNGFNISGDTVWVISCVGGWN